jgi:hypothetical protein
MAVGAGVAALAGPAVGLWVVAVLEQALAANATTAATAANRVKPLLIISSPFLSP